MTSLQTYHKHHKIIDQINQKRVCFKRLSNEKSVKLSKTIRDNLSQLQMEK